MSLLAVVKLLFQLLPLIHQLIPIVEQLFPKAGSGAQKLDAAVTMVSGILTTAGVTPDQAALMKPLITAGVNAAVAGANDAGTLSKAPDNSPPLP